LDVATASIQGVVESSAVDSLADPGGTVSTSAEGRTKTLELVNFFVVV
jgi:hypothetical protein